MKKLLVLQVAGAGYDFVRAHGAETLGGLTTRAANAVFPALTCVAQASFRTAHAPMSHGMIANGFFDMSVRRAMFWEQSAALVSGPRIWDDFRAQGGRVALAFIQQSLGEAVDAVISPAPIHTHGGGMIMDCYARPAGLYAAWQRAVGRPFHLARYWGPLASVASSDWIADALAAYLATPDAAHVVYAYLPGLDYDLQRHGPDSRQATVAWQRVQQEVERVLAVARGAGYEAIVFGDYAITPVTHEPVYPNKILREAGLFTPRVVKGRLYPDFYQSAAFAVVDHQVAAVHVFDRTRLAEVAEALRATPGVEHVLDAAGQAAYGLRHARAGDLFLIASPGTWFAYPWWAAPREAPDFATHVDIHNKPGFDPCELFFGFSPSAGFLGVSTNASRVRGTHGRVDETCRVAWWSTVAMEATDVRDIAQAVKEWLS